MEYERTCGNDAGYLYRHRHRHERLYSYGNDRYYAKYHTADSSDYDARDDDFDLYDPYYQLGCYRWYVCLEFERTCGNDAGYLYRDSHRHERLHGFDYDSDYARYYDSARSDYGTDDNDFDL